jgi:hypothetical protein
MLTNGAEFTQVTTKGAQTTQLAAQLHELP